MGDYGTGTFNQFGGTNNLDGFSSGNLYLGNFAGSSGTYNLSGAGVLSTAIEYVGYAGTGTFTQSGGINNLVSSGSTVSNGTLYLGFNSGSSGSYNLIRRKRFRRPTSMSATRARARLPNLAVRATLLPAS